MLQQQPQQLEEPARFIIPHAQPVVVPVVPQKETAESLCPFITWQQSESRPLMTFNGILAFYDSVTFTPSRSPSSLVPPPPVPEGQQRPQQWPPAEPVTFAVGDAVLHYDVGRTPQRLKAIRAWVDSRQTTKFVVFDLVPIPVVPSSVSPAPAGSITAAQLIEAEAYFEGKRLEAPREMAKRFSRYKKCDAPRVLFPLSMVGVARDEAMWGARIESARELASKTASAKISSTTLTPSVPRAQPKLPVSVVSPLYTSAATTTATTTAATTADQQQAEDDNKSGTDTEVESGDEKKRKPVKLDAEDVCACLRWRAAGSTGIRYLLTQGATSFIRAVTLTTSPYTAANQKTTRYGIVWPPSGPVHLRVGDCILHYDLGRQPAWITAMYGTKRNGAFVSFMLRLKPAEVSNDAICLAESFFGAHYGTPLCDDMRQQGYNLNRLLFPMSLVGVKPKVEMFQNAINYVTEITGATAPLFASTRSSTAKSASNSASASPMYLSEEEIEEELGVSPSTATVATVAATAVGEEKQMITRHGSHHSHHHRHHSHQQPQQEDEDGEYEEADDEEEIKQQPPTQKRRNSSFLSSSSAGAGATTTAETMMVEFHDTLSYMQEKIGQLETSLDQMKRDNESQFKLFKEYRDSMSQIIKDNREHTDKILNEFRQHNLSIFKAIFPSSTSFPPPPPS